MKIIITEEQKKKLFIPRDLSGENSRWIQWNKEQLEKYGEPINQYTYNGKKTGYWEYYWNNGQLNCKGNYINGEKDGIWVYYHENGQLWIKGNYNNGIQNGMWGYYYYTNGQLREIGNFINGKLEGIWESYLWNGQLEKKELYKNGKLVKELPLTESKEKNYLK